MTESSPNLRSLFLTAKSKQARLQDSDTSSAAYREDLQGAISTFEECRELVERLAIFSPNETAEDIATSAIQ